MKIFWALVISFLITSCSTGKTDPPVQKKSVKTIAIEKLGKDFKVAENPDGSRLLFWIKKADMSTNDKIMKLHFLVFDIKKQQLILEKKLDNSSVYWEDNYKLKIFSTPEMLTTNEKSNEELRVRYIDIRNSLSNILPRKNK
ncbi:MAG: hypothetical protein ACEPO8_15150 [Rhodothermaceae bacterium]